MQSQVDELADEVIRELRPAPGADLLVALREAAAQPESHPACAAMLAEASAPPPPGIVATQEEQALAQKFFFGHGFLQFLFLHW